MLELAHRAHELTQTGRQLLAVGLAIDSDQTQAVHGGRVDHGPMGLDHILLRMVWVDQCLTELLDGAARDERHNVERVTHVGNVVGAQGGGPSSARLEATSHNRSMDADKDDVAIVAAKQVNVSSRHVTAIVLEVLQVLCRWGGHMESASLNLAVVDEALDERVGNLSSAQDTNLGILQLELAQFAWPAHLGGGALVAMGLCLLGIAVAGLRVRCLAHFNGDNYLVDRLASNWHLLLC